MIDICSYSAMPLRDALFYDSGHDYACVKIGVSRDARAKPKLIMTILHPNKINNSIVIDLPWGNNPL